MSTTSSFNSPHPVYTAIDNKPTTTTTTTTTTYKLLRKEVYANLRSVHSDLGGGDNGYLALTIPTAQYVMRTGASFTESNHPGQQPQYALNATARQITAGDRALDKALDDFKAFVAIKAAVKAQILEAVRAMYYQELEDADFGYADVSILQLLQPRGSQVALEPGRRHRNSVETNSRNQRYR
jgi:hypothetical protein